MNKLGEGIATASMWAGIAYLMPQLENHAGIGWLLTGALIVTALATND